MCVAGIYLWYHLMICSSCNHEKDHFKSGVVDGEYVSERCTDCFVWFEQARNPNAASYKREREQEDRARDIVQPYLADGVTPNPDFAHAWPGLAKDVYYTQQQLEDL